MNPMYVYIYIYIYIYTVWIQSAGFGFRSRPSAYLICLGPVCLCPVWSGPCLSEPCLSGPSLSEPMSGSGPCLCEPYVCINICIYIYMLYGSSLPASVSKLGRLKPAVTAVWALSVSLCLAVVDGDRIQGLNLGNTWPGREGCRRLARSPWHHVISGDWNHSAAGLDKDGR